MKNRQDSRLACVRSGDIVAYITAAGHRVYREVEGWRDVYGVRLLLLDNGAHIRLTQVVERRRKGCEHGIIRFEEVS